MSCFINLNYLTGHFSEDFPHSKTAGTSRSFTNPRSIIGLQSTSSFECFGWMIPTKIAESEEVCSSFHRSNSVFVHVFFPSKLFAKNLGVKMVFSLISSTSLLWQQQLFLRFSWFFKVSWPINTWLIHCCHEVLTAPAEYVMNLG